MNGALRPVNLPIHQKTRGGLEPAMLDALRHKLRYLEGRCPPEVEKALAAAAAEVLPAGSAAIALDATYAVVRQRHWLATPLFHEALAESLASAHALDRRRATEVAAAVVALAEERLPARPSHVAATDHELLRYVFVASLAASDEGALLLDLGFGGGLLARIRLTVAMDEGPAKVGSFRFVPAIDEQIAATLSELADELATDPLAADVHRLRYHLADIADPWREALSERRADWLFALLVAIGRKRTMTVRQARELLAVSLSDALGVDWSALTTELLQAMHRHELTLHAGGTGDSARWELLPRAQELTAAAAVRELIAEKSAAGESPVAAIATLCPAYQAQLIRAMPAYAVGELEHLARMMRPLAPAALDAALTRLAADKGPKTAYAVANAVAIGDASSWLRRAAQGAMQRLESTAAL